MDRANVAASLMEHLVDHNAHGYTQGSGRFGSGGYEVVTVGGVDYTLALGDRDCSSAVIDCWRTALIGTAWEGTLDAATYTGNMRSVFVASGLFEWHPMGDGYIAQRGDIYLNEVSHTAMCISAVPDMLAEFSINEFGGITGGQVGDQTGSESHRRAYYDFPWDGILSYNGKADEMALSDSDINRIVDAWCARHVKSDWLDGTLQDYLVIAVRNSNELVRTDDPTGRGFENTMQQRLAFVGKRMDEIESQLAEIAAAVGADTAVGGTD